MAHKPDHAVVWTEFPVTDLTRSVEFYNAVFDYDMEIDESGPQPMAIFPTSATPGVGANLFVGPPSRQAGPIVHLAVSGSLEEAIDRVEPAGGSIKPGIVPLPMGRFAHAFDPDGNPIGLFQRA